MFSTLTENAWARASYAHTLATWAGWFFAVDAVLCIVGWLAATLVSTH